MVAGPRRDGLASVAPQHANAYAYRSAPANRKPIASPPANHAPTDPSSVEPREERAWPAS
jgi:hypothetical protein